MKFKKIIICIFAVIVFFLGVKINGINIAYAETPSHSHIGWTAWTTDDELPSTYGDYYLDTDVTLTEAWQTPSGTINLCLNGHVINADTNDCVIDAKSGTTLNIYDCDNTTEHKGYVDSNGLWHLGEKAELGTGEIDKTITGGVITGGSLTLYGAAISICDTGVVVNMYGGTIAGNKSNSYLSYTGKGAAVYIGNGNQFNMYGGLMEYNVADDGGAIYNGGTFTMFDGAIENNIATNGGGIYNVGSFTMTGGTVSNNNASSGGVYISSGDPTLGGTAKIINNLKPDGETLSNLYLTSGREIVFGTEDNAPKTGMNIGITLSTSEGDFAYSILVKNYLSYFSADEEGYKTKYTEYATEPKNYTFSITPAYTNTVNPSIENGTILVDIALAAAGETVTFTVTPNANYKIKDNSVEAYYYSGGKQVLFLSLTDNTYSFTMPMFNVEISAIFIEKDSVIIEEDEQEYFYSGVSQSFVIDGTNKSLGDFSITYYDSGDWTTPVSPINVGNYNVKITRDEDDNYKEYTKEIENGLVINKVNLLIKTNTKTINYNDNPDNDGVTYLGFVNGETEADLSGSLSYDYNYTKGDDVGTYVITPSGLTSGNYEIEFVPGDLRVEKINATDNTNDVNLDYDGLNQATLALLESTIDIVGVDSSTITPYSKTYSIDGVHYGRSNEIDWNSINMIDADDYVIYYKYNYTNYNLVSSSFTLTINKINATDNTIDVNLDYDGLDHANQSEIDSVIDIIGLNSEAIAPTSKKYSTNGIDYELGTNINWDSINAINAEDYTMYYKFEYANYNTVTGSFTLTINKIAQIITITNDISKPYDGIKVSDPTYTKLGDGIVTFEYKISGEDDSTYTSIAPINVGNYIVKVIVAEGTNYLSGSKTASFAISKVKVTIPSANTNLVYDGTTKTGVTLPQNALYSLSNNMNTNAGTYQAIAILNDKTNYEWNLDIASTDDQTISWSIAKAKAVINTNNVVKNYTYNGAEQTLSSGATLNNSEGILIYTNNKFTNSGSYTVIISSEETSNYLSTSENVVITVLKASVNEPTVSGTYKYTGTSQTVQLNGVESFMQTTDSLSQTDAGIYTINFSLDNNHKWNDGNDGKITWEIKSLIISPDDLEEEVILENEDGFTNDIIVKAEIIIDTDSNQFLVDYYNLNDENLKLSKKERLGVVYKVKLYKVVNGVEQELSPKDISDDTVIKVKLLIPEEIDINEVTRILHTYNNEICEIAFEPTIIDSNNYFIANVKELQEFAFIIENDNCLWHISTIILLVINALIATLFIINRFKEIKLISNLNKKKVLIYLLILSMLTLTFGLVGTIINNCDVCLTFMVIDISILLAYIILDLTAYDKIVPKSE